MKSNSKRCPACNNDGRGDCCAFCKEDEIAVGASAGVDQQVWTIGRKRFYAYPGQRVIRLTDLKNFEEMS